MGLTMRLAGMGRLEPPLPQWAALLQRQQPTVMDRPAQELLQPMGHSHRLLLPGRHQQCSSNQQLQQLLDSQQQLLDSHRHLDSNQHQLSDSPNHKLLDSRKHQPYNSKQHLSGHRPRHQLPESQQQLLALPMEDRPATSRPMIQATRDEESVRPRELVTGQSVRRTQRPDPCLRVVAEQEPRVSLANLWQPMLLLPPTVMVQRVQSLSMIRMVRQQMRRLQWHPQTLMEWLLLPPLIHMVSRLLLPPAMVDQWLLPPAMVDQWLLPPAMVDQWLLPPAMAGHQWLLAHPQGDLPHQEAPVQLVSLDLKSPASRDPKERVDQLLPEAAIMEPLLTQLLPVHLTGCPRLTRLDHHRDHRMVPQLLLQ
jgi:hypothetical protein